MTEQEAAAFAERLTRIWAPMNDFTPQERDLGPMRNLTAQEREWHKKNAKWIWHFYENLSPEFEIDGMMEQGKSCPSFQLNYCPRDGLPRLTVCIVCAGEVHGKEGSAEIYVYGTDPGDSDGDAILAAEWMPFFRRGCRLSGCDIEATAHEKAEWIQGFSREELEAWTLTL